MRDIRICKVTANLRRAYISITAGNSSTAAQYDITHIEEYTVIGNK